MNESILNKPLRLPCGAVLKNRLAKSAMTERLSNQNFEPTEGHQTLYRSWSKTGAGLLITGNVMVDRIHLESAGNIAFDDEAMIPTLQTWSEAGRRGGNHIWVQISHAGRQTSRFSALRPLAPSPVQLNKMGLFGKPKAMTDAEIEDVISRFAKAAVIAKRAGFTGV
ncbi:MAG: hypothetical protein HKN87_08915 [Saprospiraceae bacterium]|nr:hypothetical protein [Saprospiraceae bacterium]